LRRRGFFKTCSKVNGHAPTEISDDKEKDGFIDALEKPMAKAEDMF